MCGEVVAAIAAEEDESPTALARMGAISTAVAIRLATKFTTETPDAVPPPGTRRETVPDPRNNIANPTGAVTGIDMTDPYSEDKSIYLLTGHGATGWPTENFLPTLASNGGPAGQKAAWGYLKQKIETRTVRAEDLHPARAEPRRNTPGIPTQKTPVKGRTKTAKNAAGDTALTAWNATCDTAMLEEVDTPPMNTRLAGKIREG